MKHVLTIAAIPLVILVMASLLGCSSVTITAPLSKNPKPIDREKLEGAWLLNDKVFHVKFDADGIAQMAALEWESNQFSVVRGEMIVTEGAGHNFLSVRFEEDHKWKNEYLFVAYKFTEAGELILWVPDTDVFKDMVEKKLLDGNISKDKYSMSITITNTSARLLEVINDPDNLRLFEYREPVILRKVFEEEDE